MQGGYSCLPTSTCEVCCSWSEDTWKKFSKCLQRASQSIVVATAQAPEKGHGQPSASLGYFSSSSVHLTDASTRINQSPLILTELFQHNLINVSYHTACYLYQVMMTLHFLNDVANDAE